MLMLWVRDGKGGEMTERQFTETWLFLETCLKTEMLTTFISFWISAGEIKQVKWLYNIS